MHTRELAERCGVEHRLLIRYLRSRGYALKVSTYWSTEEKRVKSTLRASDPNHPLPEEIDWDPWVLANLYGRRQWVLSSLEVANLWGWSHEACLAWLEANGYALRATTRRWGKKNTLAYVSATPGVRFPLCPPKPDTCEGFG